MVNDKGLLGGFLGQIVTTSALLSGAGFLAVRSYVDGLGLPPHTTLDSQGYLEYGGRFFFALLGQILPVLATLLVLSLLVGPLLRLLPVVVRWLLLPTVAALGILLISLGAIYTETLTFTAPAMFRSGFAVDMNRTLWPVICAEALTVAAVVWAVEARAPLAMLYHKGTTLRLLALLTAACALVAVQLLPVSFGRTSMLPKSLDKVTLSTDKGKTMTGLLVFSDTKAHFVWYSSLRLVEVARDTVKEISYEGRVDFARSSK